MEILAAMQARAQDEMTIEERAGLAKKCEEIFAHLGSGRRGDLAAPNAFGVANFSWLGMSFGLPVLETFRQERRNVHARARALPRSGIISARRIISSLLGLLGSRDNFDFYIRSFRQRGHLDSGTRRGILFEIRAINFVYGLEISQIGEENRCLNNGIEGEPLGSQNGSDVVQDSPGLRGDIAGDDLTRLGVERNLAAAKEEPSAAHRLRVGADCRRRFICGNDLLHVADCNSKSNRHNESRDHAKLFRARERLGLYTALPCNGIVA